MRLRDIMETNVATIHPHQAASAAWSRMQERGAGYLVVEKNGRLQGVVSKGDLGGRSRSDIRVGRLVQDLMSTRLVSAAPDTTLREAADLMQQEAVGCLPVAKRGKLVGIVTVNEVLNELNRGSIRKPLPGWIPRPLKPRTGRRGRLLIPAHIRVLGSNLDRQKRMYVRQRLGERLGKFASSIQRVSVRVEDVNGPRGGVDQVCRIKVTLHGLPSVVFESRDASLDAAIAAALAGTERAVRKALRRRRAKRVRPRHAGSVRTAPR